MCSGKQQGTTLSRIVSNRKVITTLSRCKETIVEGMEIEDRMGRWAQQTLDELFNAGEIRFKLTAHKVESKTFGKYTVRFFDSRLHSVTVSWEVGLSFKDVLRTELLAQVREDNQVYEKNWELVA